MGLENVRNEIIAAAKKEAEAIIAKANAEVSDIARQVKHEIDAEKERIASVLESELKSLRENELSKARLEARKTILHMKSSLIDEAFARARKELEHSGKEERRNHLSALFAHAKRVMDVGSLELNKHDIGLMQAGETKGIELRESAITGGLIAHNAEGTLSLDLSYESGLADVREKVVGDIASILMEGH